MKRTISLIILLTITLIVSGQDKLEKKISAIIDEGKLLYRSEMASWYGTDIFLEKLENRKAKIGGYFSYTDNDLAKCIFFSKGDDPKVIGTIIFDSTYNTTTARIDSNEREFTKEENNLYTIRKKALAEINSDTLFKVYKNTNLNLIPVIKNDEKKVFVLTGPESNGVVVFGNDYLLTFDKNDNIQTKKRLHQNIIWTDFGSLQKNGDKTVAGIHTHLPSTGDLITSTDICTLMLYEKFTKWENYYVISEKYVSMWNCKTNQLAAITKSAWDKINEDQKKRHPGK
jgi:hypothetical protein